MANTQYALFSYSVVDELGTKANITVPAMIDPSAGTPTALSTEWTALGGLIDQVAGVEILSGSISIVKVRDGGWKSAPDAGSRVEQTGLFNFLNASSKYKFGLDIPGLADDKIAATGKINLADTDVANLISALTSSFTGGIFANTSLYPLTALADALLSFRKRRKQLARSSFEQP